MSSPSSWSWIISPSKKLPQRIRQYMRGGDERVKVFMFARSTERGSLKSVESQVKAVYIDETKLETASALNAYYPIVEIVTVALTEYLKGLDYVWKELGRLGIDVKELNIESIDMNQGALVFKLLPNAEPMPEGARRKMYANLKRCLIAA
jgi:hypothetical protein